MATVVTGPDGRFLLSGIRPADVMRDLTGGGSRVVARFEASGWTAGAVDMKVPAGGPAELGDVTLHAR